MNDLRKAESLLLLASKYETEFHKSRKESPFSGPTYAITALRDALAQPEPFNPDWDRVEALEESLREHMAEIQRLKALAGPNESFCDLHCTWHNHHPDCALAQPDQPSPPQRKPLTDAQIAKILDCERMKWATSPPTYEFSLAFARAIEKAHGIE